MDIDIKRKFELLLQWENRHPQMGIFTISCNETGEVFVGISKDAELEFNRHRFQLNAKLHRNKELQNLWNLYGEENILYTVVKLLKYDNVEEDQTNKLEILLEEYLLENKKARRLINERKNSFSSKKL